MSAAITFFPLGNADTTRLKLADGQRILFDFADMGKSEKSEVMIDLADEIRRDLRQGEKNELSILCFTHLDKDHCFGADEAFWLSHHSSYQSKDRIKFDELWVPAAAILEPNLEEPAAIAVQKEAKHRLREGVGIKIFSTPKALEGWLRKNGISLAERSHCIVNAGESVPGFELTGSAQADFFVHCPLSWVQDENGEVIRNEDSIVLQAILREGGRDTRMLLGSDINSDTLSRIVQSTQRHKNDERLEWDVLKLFHHCSYKALNCNDRGTDKTMPVEKVAWLLEEQGQERSIIVSLSAPIPTKGSVKDNDQPPHRQAAAYYKPLQNSRKGQFEVTMDDPKKPLTINITATGAALGLSSPASAGSSSTSKPMRAG
jgi:ribonuclease BN (tRNA processing enzyme)|tara:strand:- start:27285 stop:28406 length:1122 start_codon:yes stop_codon:yes gene_type:complete